MSTFYFPEIPGRPVRTVSFEQETMADTYELAAALEVSASGYHGGEIGSRGVYVEQDGSCGAEVVYSMLPLDTPEGADRARGYWATVRENTDQTSPRCGFHVHVDPTPCDFAVVQSLYHLWNGLEDPLYRIGGSGHARGHRGEAYCPSTPKGHERAAAIGGAMQRERYGLNLSRILAAMLACRCGAMQYGAFSECSCDSRRRGPTVEFRVWNGTRNARKAHGYLALSLGLIAEATRIRYDRKRVGVLDWRGESYHPAPGRMVKAAGRILSLPMTAFDRECVWSLIAESSIARVAGDAAMRSLAAQYSVGADTYSPGWAPSVAAPRPVRAGAVA